MHVCKQNTNKRTQHLCIRLSIRIEHVTQTKTKRMKTNEPSHQTAGTTKKTFLQHLNVQIKCMLVTPYNPQINFTQQQHEMQEENKKREQNKNHQTSHRISIGYLAMELVLLIAIPRYRFHTYVKMQ